MCMEPDFLNTLLKEPDGFSKYVKRLINDRGRKLEELLPQYGRKSLATKTFSEQRIKGNLNT